MRRLIAYTAALLAASCAMPEFQGASGRRRGGGPADFQVEFERAKQRHAADAALLGMATGSLAIWHGDSQLAGEMLDSAIREIETIYSGTDNAAVEARRLYHQEKEKPFKGEPYERMMAYLYRGLLDYGQGDYSNAAASFRAAILQDAFADEQQNRCDFEVAEFLLARAMILNGADQHLIDDAYGAAEELSREHGTALPPLDRRHNVLLYVEVGRSPFKVAQGEQDELLVLGRRGAGGMHATISIDGGNPVVTKKSGSLAFQAMTRGGRHFDFLLAGQAYQKESIEKGGLAINQLGTALSFIVPPVGAALQAGSLIAMAAGIGIAPQADTRYWRQLPDGIHLMTLRLAPGPHTVEVRFFDQFGEPRPSKDRQHRIEVPSDGDVLVWTADEDRWPARGMDWYNRT